MGNDWMHGRCSHSILQRVGECGQYQLSQAICDARLAHVYHGYN